VPTNCASMRLLIGEPSQSSQVTPIRAGRVSSVEAGQMLSDRGSHGRLQRQRANVDPRLEMTRAGLQHNTGLMAIGPHCFENVWRSPIHIDQNVAGVLVLCVGPDVDITTLAVANAQKSDSGRTQQLGSSPKSLTREWPSGGLVNQPDQKQTVRHGRELTPDRLHRKPQPAIPAGQASGRITGILIRPVRDSADAHTDSENQLASGSQKERSFFSERACDISALSHEWGSPQTMPLTGIRTI
jgi:hypothetical protein